MLLSNARFAHVTKDEKMKTAIPIALLVLAPAAGLIVKSINEDSQWNVEVDSFAAR